MKIKLLTQDAIKNELKEAVKDAKVIQGTVAYWTWNLDYAKKSFGSDFQKALKHKESFYCVDISTPITSIDNIHEYSQKKCNFFIFSYKLKNTRSSDEKSISLLHSKIIYIKTADKQFVFLGSHNNTTRAFAGNNMEHSFLLEFPIIPSAEDEKLLKDVCDQLKRIKDLCIKYDPLLKDFYKSIQEYDNIYKRIVLEMETEHLNLVKSGDLISIISYNDLFKPNGSSQINITEKELIIMIIDEDNNDEKYFLALGEEDSNVTKGTMKGKATESDFVTIRSRLFDSYGIPYYTSKTTPDMVISGDKLNYANHKIQRFKILYEIKYPKKVIDIGKLKKKLNYWIPIDNEDLEKLGIKNAVMLQHILKIDKTKLDTYLSEESNFEDSKAINAEAESIKYNVKMEIKEDIQKMMKDFFSFLIKTELRNPKDEINSHSSTNLFFKIYTFYRNNDKQIGSKAKAKTNVEETFLKEIKDIVMANKINKKEENFLKQYSGRYVIIEE